MRYYKFKTFRTDYYFPDSSGECPFLYGVYHPYGGFIVKLYWRLFKTCHLIRRFLSVDEKDLNLPYDSIRGLCPKGALLSFNLGTPGVGQKVSMLGHTQESGDFFAKYSVKPHAKSLTRNEIRILMDLDGKGLAPRMISHDDTSEYVFLMTECVKGEAWTSFALSDEIMNLLFKMSVIGFSEPSAKGLKHCLSHGDFCPWNMLKDEYGIRLIDWEMAQGRPLGYDLFTFLIQVPLLLGHRVDDVTQKVGKSELRIREYFSRCGVEDYGPYLDAFINDRLLEEGRKGHSRLLTSYKKLKETL